MGTKSDKLRESTRGLSGSDHIRLAMMSELEALSAALAPGTGLATEAKQDDLITNTNALSLQPCGFEDLVLFNGTYGAGKRAFTIFLYAGTAVIDGETVNAPFNIEFGESGNKNTLAGITLDATLATEIVGSTIG